MEEILRQIVEHIKINGSLDPKDLQRFIRAYNQGLPKDQTPAAKRKILALYLTYKNKHPEVLEAWGVDAQLDREILNGLRMKPQRTASGVATIAVISKPWTCSSDCVYCPSDVRMPKSYLFDEPACQRAEHNFFDPYLQVSSRLTMLRNMGHVTDKVELIVLGGTWSDYPKQYQTWFIKEMFRALNDSEDQRSKTYMSRYAHYQELGLQSDPDVLKRQTEAEQEQVSQGDLSFNQAINRLYRKNAVWKRVSEFQQATLDELEAEHRKNETAAHRVVGLVVETQPDLITPASARHLRKLGCTKVQIGVQSLDQHILDVNQRFIKIEAIERAFELLRLYGFKIHAHFMANLYQATPEFDKADFARFVSEKPFQPDEIKLYPCALIEGSQLVHYFNQGLWRPYTEDELMDILSHDILETPCYVRISRMIREFASHNIVDGNRKVNLRELVEAKAKKTGRQIQEIRSREISLANIDPATLELKVYTYPTSVTTEYFLQWVTPKNNIAGFLRLSLPDQDYVVNHASDLAILPGQAMIREVHIYGSVQKLGRQGAGAQHLGLGRQLIRHAATIAKDHGFEALNVISSVGTRQYYRSLGFEDNDLYQCLILDDD